MNNTLEIKKGFLSPYEMGALTAFSDITNVVANTAANKQQKPNKNIENIFYATAFQSGIENFVLIQTDKQYLSTSSFVLDHLSFLPQKKYFKSQDTIKNAFDNNLPTNWRQNKNFADVVRLQYFLGDLLIAANSKSSLLLVLKMPNIEEMKKYLPSTIYFPTQNLLLSIQKETVMLPIPRLIIELDDIKRYQELLTSGLFVEYSKAQLELETNIDSSQALKNVAQSGKRLFSRYSSSLILRKTAIGTLSFTPQLIETAFGKLPGVLSDMACKVGLQLLVQKRKLIIYNYNQFMLNIIGDTIIKGIEIRTKTIH